MGENPSNESPVLVERSRGGKETSLVSGAWLTKLGGRTFQGLPETFF